MKNCVQIGVPLEVDVEKGSNWGTAK